MSSPTSSDRTLRVLVYSDDAGTRNEVLRALGPRPHPDLPRIEYVEVATEPMVIAHLDTGTVDLAERRDRLAEQQGSVP